MEPIKFKLNKPFMFGSEEISELSIREPKAKDLKKFPAQPKSAGDIFDFAVSLTDQNPISLAEMSLEDSMRLVEVLYDFLPDSLKIGKPH